MNWLVSETQVRRQHSRLALCISIPPIQAQPSVSADPPPPKHTFSSYAELSSACSSVLQSFTVSSFQAALSFPDLRSVAMRSRSPVNAWLSGVTPADHMLLPDSILRRRGSPPRRSASKSSSAASGGTPTDGKHPTSAASPADGKHPGCSTTADGNHPQSGASEDMLSANASASASSDCRLAGTRPTAQLDSSERPQPKHPRNFGRTQAIRQSYEQLLLHFLRDGGDAEVDPNHFIPYLDADDPNQGALTLSLERLERPDRRTAVAQL